MTWFRNCHKFLLVSVCLCYIVAVFLVNHHIVDFVYETSGEVATKVGRILSSFSSKWGRAHTFTTIQPNTETEEATDTTEISTTEFDNTENTETNDETTETDFTNEGSQSDNFSYMVAILHKNNFLLGAGAIVGEKWILVTAFQMGAFKADQLRVRVGSGSAVAGGQMLSVERVFVHPMFKQFNNDVALLKTAEVIEPSETVRLITIAEAAPDMGDSAVMWAWGDDYNVQRNQADILPVTDCKAFYPDFDLTESNICAVLDHILPFQVTLYGSLLVFNGSLVGLYMGMEANMFKPSLCTNLPPIRGWVHAMMNNETATQLLFPLSN